MSKALTRKILFEKDITKTTIEVIVYDDDRMFEKKGVIGGIREVIKTKPIWENTEDGLVLCVDYDVYMSNAIIYNNRNTRVYNRPFLHLKENTFEGWPHKCITPDSLQFGSYFIIRDIS